MDSQQRDLWAVLFVTFGMATVSLLGRFWSRRLTQIRFWWDDYAALCAYLMAVAWMVITPVWINKGLGLHIKDVTYGPTEKVLYDSRLLLYIAELFYAFSLFFGKVSILCFYWRIFCVPRVQLAVRILLGCAVVWIIIRLFMGIFHCAPIAYFWDASIPNGYCAIDDSKFFFGTLLVHVVMDICILSLPVVSIVRLRLPWLQKAGVTLMFLFGIFVCVAAVMIMIQAVTFNATSNDFTWNVAPIVLWATAEVNLVTVSTCLPTIKPTFYWCCGRFAAPPSKFASTTTGAGTGRRSKGYGLGPSFHLRTRADDDDDDDTDGGTSTRWLTDASASASAAAGPRAAPPPDLEGYARRQQGRIRTTITGRRSADDDGARIAGGRASDGDDRGIQVRNETIVRVSYSRPKSPDGAEGDIDSEHR